VFAAESPDINGISFLPVVGNQKIHAAVNKIPIPVFSQNSVIVIHETNAQSGYAFPTDAKRRNRHFAAAGIFNQEKTAYLHVVFLYNYAKPFKLNFGIFFGEKIFLHTIKIKTL